MIINGLDFLESFHNFFIVPSRSAIMISKTLSKNLCSSRIGFGQLRNVSSVGFIGLGKQKIYE